MKMSIKKLFSTKKAVTVGAAVALTLGLGGAAFAFFTTTGNGTGDTTAGSAGTLTLYASVAGNIVPGDGGQSVTFTADNSGATGLKVTTISFVSVTSSNSDCNTFLGANTGQFTMADVSSGTVVPGKASGHALTGTGTLIWTDEAYDQTVCAGQPLTLTVSSS